MSLGELQQLTMLAVVRLGDEAYGAAIRDELRRVAGRTASVQTVWVTLVRLEEQSLTASTEVAAPEGGRPRRIFRITLDREYAAVRERHSRALAWGWCLAQLVRPTRSDSRGRCGGFRKLAGTGERRWGARSAVLSG